ncbi:poly(A)-specific ribonuclease PNLDC1 isoform X1 [Pseudonaja textilis]|uniref:poly(A)-specific ribonuclease PNLDC1 isoform X1 n=1 Tax=Pseudonaja textilis TaxID=8673 RepID=UPI000EA8AA41|nr:poly(A)-specific ribonuclease PNLDC1 isoform X1 [Pseudonaja textilis]
MRRRESSLGGMDVGAAQFPEMLPWLEELVLGCDFVGLDMEFTGLHSDSQPSLFDLPAEWYRKGRQSVQRFTVNQLGLSIFYKGMSNEYIAHSYNFFLFPATFGQMDSEFSCQTSSIQFLSHYDFDYNKFLKDGIPYMNETQEKKLQHLLSGNWMVQSFDKDKVKKVIDQVTCWISSAEEEDSMVLHDIYGFQVIELQLILRKAFPDIWTIPLEDEKLMVRKMNPQYRWVLENTAFDPCQREQILYSARGFTNIFQTLVRAKKPLVGHNMLMDLLYLHEKFYKPLPENYEEFKDNIHFLFPVLLDTKNIAKATWKEFQFRQVSYLFELYETLCSIVNPTDQLCPEIFHSDDSFRYAINKCPHEAAYDAFLCGAVLLKIAHLLLCRKTGHQTAAPTFSQYLDVLAAYMNQVNLIRGAIQKINFSGADDLTTRPPLLLATVKGWRGATEEQIHQELRSFCRFDVRRLRKNQFLLLSNHLKDIRIVMKVYKAHPNLQISVYHHWKHSPRVTSFLRICGIVASWSLLAFLLGGSYSCRV